MSNIMTFKTLDKGSFLGFDVSNIKYLTFLIWQYDDSISLNLHQLNREVCTGLPRL